MQEHSNKDIENLDLKALISVEWTMGNSFDKFCIWETGVGMNKYCNYVKIK